MMIRLSLTSPSPFRLIRMTSLYRYVGAIMYLWSVSILLNWNKDSEAHHQNSSSFFYSGEPSPPSIPWSSHQRVGRPAPEFFWF